MASGSFNRAHAGFRIAVVGAGAIGHAVLPHLAVSPLRRLTLIDGDRVERKNLERQPLFKPEDTGRFKAGVLAERLDARNGGIDLVAHDVFLDPINAHSLLGGHDIVVDGVDDLHAKALIDRTCLAFGIPLVSGAVHGGQGQVIVFHAPGANAELGRAQLFPGKLGADQDGCDMRNVPLDLLQQMGECMAARIRDVLSGGPFVNGRIEILEARSDRRMIIEPVS